MLAIVLFKVVFSTEFQLVVFQDKNLNSLVALDSDGYILVNSKLDPKYVLLK